MGADVTYVKINKGRGGWKSYIPTREIELFHHEQIVYLPNTVNGRLRNKTNQADRLEERRASQKRKADPNHFDLNSGGEGEG